MEHSTKFDLAQAIATWKQQLHDSNSMDTEQIQELESHLLDEMESLEAKELNTEEAFFVAQRRLGAIPALVQEYKKVENRTSLLLKMKTAITGVLMYGVFISFIGSFRLWFSFLPVDTYLALDNVHIITFSILASIFFAAIPIGIYHLIFHKNKQSLRFLANIPFLVSAWVFFRILNFVSIPLITANRDIANTGRFFEVSAYFINIISILTLVFLAVFAILIYQKDRKPTAMA